MDSRVEHEFQRRRNMWESLVNSGGPRMIAPHVLRDLGVYGGAQGIWVDKKRTRNVTDDGTGVTVGVLHTGSSYADDLTDDDVLYHYPKTGRQPGRDKSEIDATKAAGCLGLPVFVIHYPTPSSKLRNVEFAWVEGWDDESEMFLLSFTTEQPELLDDSTDDARPFDLIDNNQGQRSRKSTSRPGQQRFKLKVVKRYGLACAVCGVTVKEMLDAAHIRPKESQGSDDPRNGLVLCANHHRAFDRKLFGIEPETLTIVYRDDQSAGQLGIHHESLSHLRRLPHQDALRWRWKERPI